MQLPCGVHYRMAILLNLEIIFIITTALRNLFARLRLRVVVLFCKYFAKIYFFSHSFVQVEYNICVTDFEYRCTLQMLLHILEK